MRTWDKAVGTSVALGAVSDNKFKPKREKSRLFQTRLIVSLYNATVICCHNALLCALLLVILI